MNRRLKIETVFSKDSPSPRSLDPAPEDQDRRGEDPRAVEAEPAARAPHRVGNSSGK